MHALRFPIALAAGFLLNATVFSFLWALINVHFSSHEVQQATKIEFTRLRRDTDVATIKREKPQPLKPVQAQAVPQISVAMAPTSTGERVSIDAPVVDARSGLKGLLGGVAVNVAGSDRDVMPLVRIEPDYPRRASERGVEGWVVVQFTITPVGTVKDAQVVEAQPKGVFDDAATKAVERWKYNPKIENGVAVERRGVQVMLTFKLEKGKG